MSGDELTVTCQRLEHDQCPHSMGEQYLRSERRVVLRLCHCPCHQACPVTAARPATRQIWPDKCRCPGSEKVRRRLTRSAEVARQRRERMEQVFHGADLSSARSRKEMQEQLEAALSAADVQVGPTVLDLVVRTRWAERGPGWLLPPRRWLAVLHSSGVGLRSLVRHARDAPVDQPSARRQQRPGQWRLPGGISADRDGVIMLGITVLGSVVAALLASRRRGAARRRLCALAGVLAIPELALLGLSGLVSFLLRALSGYAEEHKDLVAEMLNDDAPSP